MKGLIQFSKSQMREIEQIAETLNVSTELLVNAAIQQRLNLRAIRKKPSLRLVIK